MNKKIKKSGKIYAFIDSQNLNRGTQAAGWKLDFGKFRLYLKNKYKVSKAFLFIGYIEGNAALYRYLQECGYILIFKSVLEIKKGNKTKYKGNVDAELVLQAMLEFKNYKKAIIVTGDGDFNCLIEHLEKQNKLLKIIAPNKRYSSLLRKFANRIFTLEQVRDKLRLSTKKDHKKNHSNKQVL